MVRALDTITLAFLVLTCLFVCPEWLVIIHCHSTGTWVDDDSVNPAYTNQPGCETADTLVLILAPSRSVNTSTQNESSAGRR